jgi:hypothetical protein
MRRQKYSARKAAGEWRFFVSQLSFPDEAFSAMAPFRVRAAIGLFP